MTGAGIAFSTLAAPPAAVAGGAASGATYVALGDSYSSGEGLGPFEAGTDISKGKHQNTCHRSQGDAYPELSDIVLPSVTSRGFWACSGATVHDMETSPKQYGQPKQVGTVSSSTHFISLTVGGDDEGFGLIGKDCAQLIAAGHTYRVPGAEKSCADQLTKSRRHFDALRRDLVTLYQQLLTTSASDSQLVVAGYPKVLPNSIKGFCTFDRLAGLASVGMPQSDAKAVASFEHDLNGVINGAVKQVAATNPGRIAYADLYPTSVPRDCDGYTRNATVTGLELSAGHGGGPLGLVSSATFHPTKAGQKVYARAVQAAFQSLASTALHSIVFDDSPGSDAPPATLGPYTMRPFAAEPAAQDSTVSTINGPTGAVPLSIPGTVLQVGDGWATWSHDYTGKVYAFGDLDADSATTVTLALPPGTKAIYFYAEPNEFETFDLEADANNGTTSGHEAVYGDSGASYFGFYAQPGFTITSIKVSCSDAFALGEFAISS